MNATFKIDGCYELEITSDGSLTTRDPYSASATQKGHVGVLLHYTPMVVAQFIPNEDGSPANLPTIAPAETRTRAAIFLKRNQARAIASALLNAVSEAGEI